MTVGTGALDGRPAAATSVLFVCMGNICRSPTAEGVFRAVAARAGLLSSMVIDSAGTHDYHIGAPPDRRAILAARKRGYDIAPLRARQVMAEDFRRFGHIYAMDESNLRALQAMRPAGYDGVLGLYLDVAPELGLREVPDPYHGGPEGFEQVLNLVERASEALVLQLAHVHPQ
jgi:protein-tyrosine phosphatase